MSITTLPSVSVSGLVFKIISGPVVSYRLGSFESASEPQAVVKTLRIPISAKLLIKPALNVFRIDFMTTLFGSNFSM
jgi:hypothetical protein